MPSTAAWLASRRAREVRALAAAAVLLLVSACGSDGSGGGGRQFAAVIDNPWFPLMPRTSFVYRGARDGAAARELVTVTHRTKELQGVRAIAVRDLLYLEGKLAERTVDWYAQDVEGNVWYLGEKTAELDRRGRVVSTEGSWLAGVDGAQAGIFMPAHPKLGAVFRQEYYKGHAEDHFRVMRVREKTLVTREWTPLEPAVIGFKVYSRGIGLVRERSADGAERLELVAVRKD